MTQEEIEFAVEIAAFRKIEAIINNPDRIKSDYYKIKEIVYSNKDIKKELSELNSKTSS